jgi:hypothetical protein
MRGKRWQVAAEYGIVDREKGVEQRADERRQTFDGNTRVHDSKPRLINTTPPRRVQQTSPLPPLSPPLVHRFQLLRLCIVCVVNIVVAAVALIVD